jgi:hypothetical protein
MRTARTIVLLAAGPAAGVIFGLWMASLSYPCLLCVFAAPRFALWESCLVGATVGGLVLIVAVLVDEALLPRSARGLRSARHFLFKDLGSPVS